jgi:hypothetical protein
MARHRAAPLRLPSVHAVSSCVINGLGEFIRLRNISARPPRTTWRTSPGCSTSASHMPHPERRDSAVWDVFETERPSLGAYVGKFDGFHARTASVSRTCLVQFDKNKFSVMAHAVGRPVEIHTYADRIVIRRGGQIVADYAHCFGREQTNRRRHGCHRGGCWSISSSTHTSRRRATSHSIRIHRRRAARSSSGSVLPRLLRHLLLSVAICGPRTAPAGGEPAPIETSMAPPVRSRRRAA